MFEVVIMHKIVAENVEKHEKTLKKSGEGRLFCRYDVSFLKI